MRGGPRFAAVLASAVLAAPAVAQSSIDRERFVAEHRCAVLTRLTRIHDVGPRDTSRDRFLVVILRGKAQHYVQCIFFDGDTRMQCEASSGAYRFRDDGDERLVMAPDAEAALRRLGFTLPDARENFQQELDLGTPPRLGMVATLLLTALHDAYGARPGSILDYTAPKARGIGTTCTPSS